MWQATQFRDTNAINDGVAMALNSTERRYLRPELERRSLNFSYMTILRAAEFFYRGLQIRRQGFPRRERLTSNSFELPPWRRNPERQHDPVKDWQNV